MKIEKENWEIIRLGEILERANNSVQIIPTEKYKLLGMRLEGRGLFIREEKLGAEISSKYTNRVVANQFIYSRLFAWKGAFDFVRQDFKGCYCSDEFPAFELDESKIDIKFLHYYFNQESTWREVEQFCIGVTKASRNRFKEQFLLSLKIPLPPLAEQQRIANNLDNLKSKIEEVKRLREEQDKLRKNLLFSQFSNIIKEAEWLPMREIAPIIRRDIQFDENASYPELGLRSFGKGTFHKPNLSGIDVGTKKLYQIKAGDLMFSNVFAWEGAIAVAKDIDEDRYGSHRFISCLVMDDKALADFLCFYFLTEKGMEDINAASPGGAGRNKTLGLDKLMRIKVPIPSLDIQQNFVNLITKLNEAKAHQTAQLEALERLFPAMLDKAFKGEL